MGDKFRRFILLLRKLGILRYGVKTYKYTSGKDMPAKALLDDVYDEEKDLMTKEDFKKVARMLKPKPSQPTARFCSRCGAKLPLDTGVCSACNMSLKQ